MIQILSIANLLFFMPFKHFHVSTITSCHCILGLTFNPNYVGFAVPGNAKLSSLQARDF